MQISCGDLDQNRTDRNVFTPVGEVRILLHLLSQNPVTEYIVVDTFLVPVRALVFVYKNLVLKSEAKRSLQRCGRKVR